jgi:hypothetical protein
MVAAAARLMARELEHEIGAAPMAAARDASTGPGDAHGATVRAGR